MVADYNKFKVADLRAELKRLGLPQTGLKAELVARLEDATTQDVGDDQDTNIEPTAEDAPSDASGTAQSATPEDTGGPPPPEYPQKPLSVAVESGTPSETPTASDVAQDAQKRKRRSLSSAPNSHDASVKRFKPSDLDSPSEVVQETSGLEESNAAQPDSELEPEQVINTQTSGSNGAASAAEVQIPSQTTEQGPNNGDGQDETMQDMPIQDLNEYVGSHGQAPPEEDQQSQIVLDGERSVDPSIHPATNALYIRNFMRPLRPQAVQDHLLNLVTPIGAVTDDTIITDFYLDTIRTHAFVIFSSVSAAARVRTALHDRVWPDETNRRSLWVDFIPPERFADWIKMEQATGGRGSSSRCEVVYDTQPDGNVTAQLVDTGGVSAPSFNRQTQPRQPGRPEWRPSIPSEHSQQLQGVPGAPLGPRAGNEGRHGGHSIDRPGREEKQDMYAAYTRAYPRIPFQPVSEQLADHRLASISAAKSKSRYGDFGKEYRRYYFENGDFLVDRGQEIFLGIRPPHRERERRHNRGGGGVRRGYGREGGGRGGFGFAPHGVPRGGDRFRPSGSSGFGPAGGKGNRTGRY